MVVEGCYQTGFQSKFTNKCTLSQVLSLQKSFAFHPLPYLLAFLLILSALAVIHLHGDKKCVVFPHSSLFFTLKKAQLLRSVGEEGRPFYSSMKFNKCFVEVILHFSLAYVNRKDSFKNPFLGRKKKDYVPEQESS